VQAEAQERPAAAKKGRKAAAGQKEMLLPIAGKKAAHAESGKSHAESGKTHAESGKSRASAKHRKAG
jgi:DNA end-binding protein Ku